jgi:hypothetical protein
MMWTVIILAAVWVLGNVVAFALVAAASTTTEKDI